MSDSYQILFEYLDELLRVQSKAAEMFEHKGVLGTARENFLIQQIRERVDNTLIHTGEVTAGGLIVGQSDLIIRKQNTLNPEIGGQVRIPANQCAAVIEVKSNARGTDFTAFNLKAGKIKEENSDALCGFFCYRLTPKKRTILKRFGINYDNESLAFEKGSLDNVEYKYIDFVICMDDEKEYFERNGNQFDYSKYFYLRKNSKPNEPYNLILKPPFSQYFLFDIKGVSN